jgi:hypothetical protein
MKDEVNRSDLLRQLWTTLAAPLATELGCVAALFAPAWVAVLMGLVALLVLAVLLPRLRPSDGMARVTVAVAGPPLRYLLLILAVWRVWFLSGEGIVAALLVLLALGFGIPLVAFLIAQNRARSSGTTNAKR